MRLRDGRGLRSVADAGRVAPLRELEHEESPISENRARAGKDQFDLRLQEEIGPHVAHSKISSELPRQISEVLLARSAVRHAANQELPVVVDRVDAAIQNARVAEDRSVLEPRQALRDGHHQRIRVPPRGIVGVVPGGG